MSTVLNPDEGRPYVLRTDAREANYTKCRELKICRTVDEEHAIHRLCAQCFREFSDEAARSQSAGGRVL